MEPFSDEEKPPLCKGRLGGVLMKLFKPPLPLLIKEGIIAALQ